MINVIEKGINPIFEKDDYPKLALKKGIDGGENVSIQYGFDKSASIDLESILKIGRNIANC